MSDLSAQVSLYPLRQPSLSPAISEALRIFRGHGLTVQPGAMSTLISGSQAALWLALQEALGQVASQGEVVMVVTLSNACPAPDESRCLGEEESVTYRFIGRVANEINEPTVPETIRAVESRIILDPELAPGLEGLEPGGRVMVVFYFHLSAGYELRQHPRGDPDRPLRGVFALCSPRRPNPVGVTVADLLAVEGNVLTVRGLDAVNGTPVLDLKPA